MKKVQIVEIDLRLDDAAMKALTYFQKLFYRKKKKVLPQHLAGFLLNLALAHPEELTRWVNGFAHYRDSEGFTNHAPLDPLDLLSSLVSGRKEYRRIRTPEVTD